MRRKLQNLLAQRTALLQDAENALAAGNQADYTAAMEKVSNINTEISQIQDLIAEQDRQFLHRPAPTGSEADDMAEDRGAALLRGESITFTADEAMRGICNMVTVGTGTIAQPSGVGTIVRDAPGAVVSSIVDQVHAMDLTGMGSYQEPYIISDMAAQAGALPTVGGTVRTPSDPTFGIAEIKPYEVSVTTYADRNIANITPTAYLAKIQQVAMRALRSKVAGLIVNGDGAASPIMYGILNAKNKAGASIVATAPMGSAIAATSLDELYFAYGSGDAVGANSRLLLTKANLKAIGQLRGTNEKRRVFEITPDPSNPNTGVIRDGGTVIPYTLIHDIGDTTLAYGDPMNYGLGLFGGYSVRVDESYKAGERLLTVLGDVIVGGNVIAHHGFVVGTIAASGT